MNKLTDDQKQRMWDEISQAISFRDDVLPGEKTTKMLASELNCSIEKARKFLNKLESAGVIGSRTVISNGGRMKVYFPLEDCSLEELSVKLRG